MEEVKSFREDYLGTYYYDDETNEVEILYKDQSGRLEASVLIETLASAIVDISITQSSAINPDTETVHLLRHLVEDYLPEIGMTIHFREMFYQIVGEPYPDWLEIPEPNFYEREWMENHSLHRKMSEESGI